MKSQKSIDQEKQPNLYESIEKFFVDSLEVAKSSDSLLALYVLALFQSLQVNSLEMISQLEPVGNESLWHILSKLIEEVK